MHSNTNASDKVYLRAENGDVPEPGPKNVERCRLRQRMAKRVTPYSPPIIQYFVDGRTQSAQTTHESRRTGSPSPRYNERIPTFSSRSSVVRGRRSTSAYSYASLDDDG